MPKQFPPKYLPSWAKNLIIYQIDPLGFFACPPINPIAKIKPAIKQIQPVTRLAKIRKYYPYFKDLGIGAIHFGPLFESCTHGYDTINYFQIDRRLGTNQLFKEIVTELHNLNIKVIIDGIFNHTSRLFPAFVDIKQNKSKSKFISWYQNINFNQNTIWNDGFNYSCFQNVTELPLLNLSNIDVRQLIFKTIHYWIKEFNLDGIRLDVAYNIQPEFWQQFRQCCKDTKHDFLLAGELIDDDYNQWINKNTLDTGTNYQYFQHLRQSYLHNDFWQLQEIISKFNKLYPELFLINFLGNHDTDRIYNHINDPIKIKSIFAFLFFLPGITNLYYGDELNLTGKKHPLHDLQLRPSLPEKSQLDSTQQNFLSYIKKLIFIRNNNPGISRGKLTTIFVDNNVFIAQNTFRENKYIIVINNQKSNQNFLPQELQDMECIDLLNDTTISLDKELAKKTKLLFLKEK